MALSRQSPDAGVNQERLSNVEMALEALRNVIRNNPGMIYIGAGNGIGSGTAQQVGRIIAHVYIMLGIFCYINVMIKIV